MNENCPSECSRGTRNKNGALDICTVHVSINILQPRQQHMLAISSMADLV